MTITRLHMSVTLLLALALHGGIAMWLAQSAPTPLPEPPEKTLHVSLLATVAETATPALPVTPPPKPEPKPKPVSPPKPKPEPVPEPVIQAPSPELPPIVKPAAEPLPVEQAPELAQIPDPVQPPPAEPYLAPLNTVATAKYEQLLVAWLEKHKKYPRRAKRMRIEGEGMLRILIDRTGKAQQVTLVRRTGNRLLDRAVLEMAEKASPFPPMPENDPRQELEFIVPVVFALR